jgi:hypothetical protein
VNSRLVKMMEAEKEKAMKIVESELLEIEEEEVK